MTTDVSKELLRAKAQAKVEELTAEAVAKRAPLALEFNQLESTVLAKVCIAAAADMKAEYLLCEDDEQRLSVLISQEVLAGIAMKFKAAIDVAKAAPLGAPFDEVDKPINE